jgi:hypothetical protein
MDGFHFALYGLAVWRVAAMLAGERGPFDLFDKWRRFVGAKFPPKGSRQHWVEFGFNCPLCISFWLSLMTAWVLTPPDLIWYLVAAMAASAVTSILAKW